MTAATETASAQRHWRTRYHPDNVPTLPELIATALTSRHVVDGHFIRMDAYVDGDWHIVLDVTGTDFCAGTDTTLRVLVDICDADQTPMDSMPTDAQIRAEIASA